ncbi:hypothetical protein Adt_14780 [Abeliophyllum distichum]|uniref:Uncharacterized protein n=1 Tax=Abeliophyllum distichum TaxID=126358 RepID=A0ABD1U0L3_9LAMI
MNEGGPETWKTIVTPLYSTRPRGTPAKYTFRSIHFFSVEDDEEEVALLFSSPEVLVAVPFQTVHFLPPSSPLLPEQSVGSTILVAALTEMFPNYPARTLQLLPLSKKNMLKIKKNGSLMRRHPMKRKMNYFGQRTMAS